MKKNLLYFLLGLLLLEILIEPSLCSIGSRRRTKTKENNEKKEEKEEEEEPEEVDLNKISPNATFTCAKCSGKYCSDSFLKFNVNVDYEECAPGELCWKSNTKYGYFRGCASRECVQSVESNDFDMENSTENIFLSNICCASDLCNSGITKHVQYVALFVLQLVAVFVSW